MWYIIIGMLIGVFLLGLLYISFRAANFKFIKNISDGRKPYARLLCFISFASLTALLWWHWDIINAMICMVHLVLFWLICDFVSLLICRIRRKKTDIYWAGAAALILCSVYLAAGWIGEHHVRFTNYELKTDKLDRDLRIIQFADSHLGATFDSQKFSVYIDEINTLSPDVVVVTGDFVDDDTKRDDLLGGCDALGRLRTKYGVFFVYGNHDKGYSSETKKGWTDTELRDKLAENNVVLLEDEAADFDGFTIVGRKDRSEEQRNRTRKTAEQLFSGLDRNRYLILLDHQPYDFDAEAEAGADLVLCGHTHGGQLIPIRHVGEWIGENDLRYGHEKRLNTDFIVTSGISNWKLQFKTGCFSEITVIDIIGTKISDTLSSEAGQILQPAPEGLKIAVATDLHFDPDNTDKSGELSAVVYNAELTDALLWDTRQQGAKILLLTGDLVNGGKIFRHTGLVEKLQQAEESGMEIYVLPGNHDLSPVSQTEFAELYASFGFSEAYSRDTASLSYCILREDVMILMMDTGGYSISAIDLPGVPERTTVSAFLSEKTLQWAEDMLIEAKKRSLPVLCAGHYNLLPAASREPGGFYVENGTRFADLLREYSVPLYLSGHMHIRAVYQEDGLTELLSEYLLAYPSGYSLLNLTGDMLQVIPRRIDVDSWASENGLKDPVLLRYAAWQQEELRKYCKNVVESMVERDNTLNEQEIVLASDFFYQTMDAYWAGTLYHQKEMLEALPGYRHFFYCADGYSFGWWLKDLFETASPMMAGFTLSR